MEKKVMKLCEAAKRGAEAAGEMEEAHCVDALDQLNKSPIDCQLLASTQLVSHILPLTKHPRKKIQDLASNLIVSWRNMFLDQMKRGELQPAKVENEDQNSAPSCSRKVVSRSESHDVVLDPQKKKKKKLTCMIKCNHYFRDKVREKFHQSLSKVSREFDDEVVKECDPIRVAVAVESVLFENWGPIFGSYEIKYRNILSFLDDPHPDFRRKVLLGEVSPEALLKIRTEEMLSDRLQLYTQQIKEENAIMDEKSRAGRKAALLRDTKDTYKCGRCGHTGTTYTSKKNYAVDIVCLNCYQYWESTDIPYGLLSVEKNVQSQPKRIKPKKTVRFGSVQYFD